MRRKLLAISGLTAAALGAAMLWPPVSPGPGWTRPAAPAWQAWRDRLLPPGAEWVWVGGPFDAPHSVRWPWEHAWGLFAASDSSTWTPRDIAAPTLLLEGAFIVTMGALLAAWVVAGARHRHALQVGVPPTRIERWGPIAILGTIVGLVAAVAAIRVPTRHVELARGLRPPVVLPGGWVPADQPGPHTPFEERRLDPLVSWRWAWEIEPPGSGAWLGNGMVDRTWGTELATGTLATEYAAILTATALAAWLGIVRPRRRWRAAAARSVSYSDSGASP